MTDTSIEYLDKTWNVAGGCSPCAKGCLHCWAARQASGRLKNHKLYKGLTKDGKWTGEIRLCTNIYRSYILEQPLHWRKPCNIGVQFMGDLFHPDIPFDFIGQVVMKANLCPQHNFFFLTKHPGRMGDFFCEEMMPYYTGMNKAPDNFWLGTSISTQEEADENIPELLEIDGKLWLSIEPMIEEIQIKKFPAIPESGGCPVDPLRGEMLYGEDYIKSKKIDWIVVGGESGPKARPMHPDWVRSIRDQCKAASVPFFFKQWGEYLHKSQGADTSGSINAGDNSKKGYLWPDKTWSIRVGKKKAGHLLDGVTYQDKPK